MTMLLDVCPKVLESTENKQTNGRTIEYPLFVRVHEGVFACRPLFILSSHIFRCVCVYVNYFFLGTYTTRGRRR